jgi:hypothetical protein
MYRKNKVFPSATDRLKALRLTAFSLKGFSLPEGHYVPRNKINQGVFSK